MKPGFTKKDFRDMLKPNGECLVWTGCCVANGYGRTKVNGRATLAHRLALELEGVDTTGHYVLHSCDNPRCCNPDHLRTGTAAENSADMTSRGRQSRKLTEQDVLEIRAITGMSQRAIADQYGVHRTVINRIINRKRWKHI